MEEVCNGDKEMECNVPTGYCRRRKDLGPAPKGTKRKPPRKCYAVAKAPTLPQLAATTAGLAADLAQLTNRVDFIHHKVAPHGFGSYSSNEIAPSYDSADSVIGLPSSIVESPTKTIAEYRAADIEKANRWVKRRDGSPWVKMRDGSPTKKDIHALLSMQSSSNVDDAPTANQQSFDNLLVASPPQSSARGSRSRGGAKTRRVVRRAAGGKKKNTSLRSPRRYM